jgi:S1-C subfamily serine protease
MPGAPVAAANAGDIVGCYDAARDLVTHGLAAACRGEVIDAAREAELAAMRKRRVQRALGGGADPVTGNRRLIGTGSGFYVDRDGAALTNNHVVERCAMVTVTSEGSAKREARVVATDRDGDLALLRAAGPAPAVAAFNAAPARSPGSDLAVVGYPAYGLPTIRSSLVPASASAAVLASEQRDIVFQGLVRRGHSGSPLLDESGNVVGIIKAKPDSVKFYKATKRLPPDVGVGVSEAATLRFLALHGVRPTLAPASEALTRPALLEKARGFVAQIGCWQ